MKRPVPTSRSIPSLRTYQLLEAAESGYNRRTSQKPEPERAGYPRGAMRLFSASGHTLVVRKDSAKDSVRDHLFGLLGRDGGRAEPKASGSLGKRRVRSLPGGSLSVVRATPCSVSRPPPLTRVLQIGVPSRS